MTNKKCSFSNIFDSTLFPELTELFLKCSYQQKFSIDFFSVEILYIPQLTNPYVKAKYHFRELPTQFHSSKNNYFMLKFHLTSCIALHKRKKKRERERERERESFQEKWREKVFHNTL